MEDDPARGFQLRCLPIGAYQDAAYETVAAVAQAQRIAEILRPLGADSIDVWEARDAERTLTAAHDQLSAWSSRPDGGSSLVYWVGHGESVGTDAWLAVYGTEPDRAVTGVRPQAFADAIFDEWLIRNSRDPQAWAAVVVDACGAGQFTQQVVKRLTELGTLPQRFVLVNAAGQGAGELGHFSRRLAEVVEHFLLNDDAIPVHELFGRLEDDTISVFPWRLRQVPPLINRRRLLARPVAAPMDVHGQLLQQLRTAPAATRDRLLPTAPGSEHGELTWDFTGRARERAEIAAWLHRTACGMLIVTGPPGTGKSALLGQVLAETDSAQREPRTDPDASEPAAPAAVFDTVVHLGGMTADEVVDRLAQAAGVLLDRGTAAGDVAQLLAALRAGPQQAVTILADALDESREPAAIAQSVLAPLAELAPVRILVGTRPSTDGGTDLLQALSSGSGPRTQLLRLGSDRDGVAAYVRSRLAAADGGAAAADRMVALAASAPAGPWDFLTARLAVHEYLADAPPDRQRPDQDLPTWLSGTPAALLEHAIRRIGATSPTALPLLRALALAQGRGLPRADRIWARVAAALDGSPPVIREQDIDRLLHVAAPYVMVDSEDGRGVFRLAHRSVMECFAPHRVEDHAAAVRELVEITRATLPDDPDPYLVRHLSAHAAQAPETWAVLAEQPQVLDRLDPAAVAADLLRSTFGRRSLPAELCGMTAMHPVLQDLSPRGRALHREIAMTRHAEPAALAQALRRPQRIPFVSWSAVAPAPPHVLLQDAVSTGPIWALAVLRPTHGPALLASGGDDGRVRLWDPLTARPIGRPLGAHDGPVAALASVPLADGRVLLAAGGADGVLRVWDPVTRQRVLDLPSGHDGGIRALAALRTGQGRDVLASAGRDRTVRLWELPSGRPLGAPLRGHTGTVTALAVMGAASGRPLLASAGDDGTVRMWDPVTARPLGDALRGHTGVVLALACLPADSGEVLASAGAEGCVRLTRPGTDRRLGRPHRLRHGAVNALTAFPSPPGAPDGPWQLASGGFDGALRTLALPRSRTGILHGSGSGSGPVYALHLLRVDERTLVASGHADGAIRIWDPHTARPDRTVPLPRCTAPLPASATRPAAVALGHADGTVRIVAAATGHPTAKPWRGPGGPVRALTRLSTVDGTVLLATGHDRGAVQVWDPATGHRVGPPLVDPRAGQEPAERVQAMTELRGTDGRRLLAVAHRNGLLRWWDPATGKLLGDPVRAHDGPVRALAAADGLVVSGGEDGMVLLHDPDADGVVGAPLRTGRPVTGLVVLRAARGPTRLAVTDGYGLEILDPIARRTVSRQQVALERDDVDRLTALAAVPSAEGTLYAASGSEEGALCLWDAGSPDTVRPLLRAQLGAAIRSMEVVEGHLVVVHAAGTIAFATAELLAR